MRCFILLTILTTSAFSKVKVCHLSYLNERLIEKKQIESSQTKAYQFILKNLKKDIRDLVDFTYFKDEKNNSIIQKLHAAKKENCDILVGFPTSKENLLAARFAYRNKMMLYSTTSSSSFVSKYFPYVLSSYPSDRSYGHVLKQNLLNTKSEITVVIQRKGDSFSRNNYDSLLGAGLAHYAVDEKNVLNVVSKLDFKKKVSFVFTTELHKSIELLRALALKGKNIQIYGPLEWSFVPSLKIAKRLKYESSVKIYIPRVMRINSAITKQASFISAWKKEYSKVPNDLETFTYDTFYRVVNCIKTSKADKINFRNCLVKRGIYQGVAANYHFKAQTHPSLDISMVQL